MYDRKELDEIMSGLYRLDFQNGDWDKRFVLCNW